MSIKHYGLDAAEIEALEAQGKTDDEINAANEKRIKEQMDAAPEDDGIPEPTLADLVNGKCTDEQAAKFGLDGNDDSEGSPILTDNEYYIEEAKILKANGIEEPTIPEDDATPEELENWKRQMKEYVSKKQELCGSLRNRRQLGCYEVENGADGDRTLPQEWTRELIYLQ